MAFQQPPPPHDGVRCTVCPPSLTRFCQKGQQYGSVILLGYDRLHNAVYPLGVDIPAFMDATLVLLETIGQRLEGTVNLAASIVAYRDAYPDADQQLSVLRDQARTCGQHAVHTLFPRAEFARARFTRRRPTAVLDPYMEIVQIEERFEKFYSALETVAGECPHAVVR